MRRLRQAQVVVLELRDPRHGNFALHAVTSPQIPELDVRHLPRIVPVPRPHLFEEFGEVSRGDDLLSGGPDQHARRQRGHQTDDLLLFPDRRQFVHGAEQATFLQRGQE